MTSTRTSFKKPKEKRVDARLSVDLGIIKMGEEDVAGKEKMACENTENSLLVTGRI